jgi:hypothetical protein
MIFRLCFLSLSAGQDWQRSSDKLTSYKDTLNIVSGFDWPIGFAVEVFFGGFLDAAVGLFVGDLLVVGGHLFFCQFVHFNVDGGVGLLFI